MAAEKALYVETFKSGPNKENISQQEAYASGSCDSSEELEDEQKSSKQGKRRRSSEEEKTEKKEKWTNEKISKLIDEYEARPCLWDVFSADYHNREVTGKAKQMLEEIFGLQWKEISNQLTKLRQILAQNVKKMKAVKSGQSTDELFKPTWHFWKSLQFLLPVMNARPSRDVIILPDESPNKSAATNSTDDEAPTVCMPPAVKQQKSNKPMRVALNEAKEELMMECLRVMKTPEPSTAAAPTAESSFGTYITEKLKLLDRRRRMVAEKKICDIIWELQMDMEQSMTSDNDSSFAYMQPPYPMTSTSDQFGNHTMTNLLQWPH